MENVLITDGESRPALAIVRSLGKNQNIIVISKNKTCISGSSKYCNKFIQVADPYNNPDSFIEQLRNIISDNNINVCLPVTEISTRLILEHFRDELLTPYKSFTSFKSLSNKINVCKLAEKLNIPFPKSIFIEHSQELKENEIKSLEFPVYLKPAESRYFYMGEWKIGDVKRIENIDSLLSVIKTEPYSSQPYLIQKEINGTGEGIFSIFEKNEPLVWFSHQRIREKPPAGGVSTARKSIKVQEDIKTYSELILKETKWNGPVMVEFRREKKTGIPFIMEINARFWGSLQLAIDAGLDFPKLAYNAAIGSVNNRIYDYKENIVTCWELGELDHLISIFSKKKSVLGMPNDWPGRYKTLLSVLSFFQENKKAEIFRLTDLKPFLTELYAYFFDN